MACCNRCLVKTDAFIAAMLSIAVLAFSSIVLISSSTYSKHSSPSDQPKSTDNTTVKPFAIKPILNETELSSTAISSTTPAHEYELYKEERESNNGTKATATITVNITNVDKLASNAEGWTFFQNHDFWKGKPDTYIILMQTSSGVGVFAAILQLGFSWLLICGSNKDLKDRTKLWHLSSFIVLILLVVIILVPLSYNSINDTFKGTSVFWREIYKRITSIEFSYKTLQIVWNSPSNFLDKDLALYYYVLGINAFVLFTFLIPPVLCCFCYPFKRCCCKKKRGRTDSDLTLFGTNYGGTF